ncbi:hypothetical protein [Sinosporangium siamense]|uniref:Uncharacterized protein n=1 Tax=Sinosporangium siamense TaxID=1367973 RepID=A0A919RC37_9ACTN|nr:hypothetical protein [Sinosporangium siamense]GII90937.1 hypothetical protein Ssi02_11680 [Sinosporangium siamense]
MSSLLDRIPIITVEAQAGEQATSGAAPADRPASGAASTGMGRRGFLRTVAVGGTALAMTALGWIANVMPAYAVGRKDRHPRHCMGVNVSGDVACWGRQYISGSYCGSDGYHRLDRVSGGPGVTLDYNWQAACGGYAGWYWTSGGRRINCWDGYYDVFAGGIYRSRTTTACRR